AVLLLDDVGYIQQSPEEAEVLFTLLAERYERRSVFITSNLIFAHWNRIFRDQMATAAAIDRLVHHSVLLEFDVPSFRTEHATRRAAAPRPVRRPTRHHEPDASEPIGYLVRLHARRLCWRLRACRRSDADVVHGPPPAHHHNRASARCG